MQDRVAVKLPSRARGDRSIFADRSTAKGTVTYINPRFFTIRTEKGYNVTVLFQDFICGQVKLLDHRRGGKKVDQADSGAGKKIGAAAAEAQEGKETDITDESKVERRAHRKRVLFHRPDEYTQF